MTVSMESQTVRIVKSQSKKNQSKRLNFPQDYHITKTS